MAFSAFTNQYVNMDTLTISINTQGLANTFYFVDDSSSVDIALPVGPAQGDLFGVSSLQDEFVITQIAGQQCRVVGNLTTLGALGSIVGPSAGCGIILRYESSNGIWVMQSIAGGLSVN